LIEKIVIQASNVQIIINNERIYLIAIFLYMIKIMLWDT